MGATECHPDCVVDPAGSHLLIADEPRQDGESGGICTGPAQRTERVRSEVESCARGCDPASTGPAPDEQFEELTRPLLQCDHVPVAGCGARCPLDRRFEGNRERTGIAFAAVCVIGDRYRRLVLRNDDVGNAVVRILAEVRVQVVASNRLNPRDDRAAARVQGRGGNIRVPRIVAGENPAPANARAVRRRQPFGGCGDACRTIDRRFGSVGDRRCTGQQHHCRRDQPDSSLHHPVVTEPASVEPGLTSATQLRHRLARSSEFDLIDLVAGPLRGDGGLDASSNLVVGLARANRREQVELLRWRTNTSGNRLPR